MNRADRALIIIIRLFCGGVHATAPLKYFTSDQAHYSYSKVGGCGQIVLFERVSSVSVLYSHT